jgi:hypothetical protein
MNLFLFLFIPALLAVARYLGVEQLRRSPVRRDDF